MSTARGPAARIASAVAVLATLLAVRLLVGEPVGLAIDSFAALGAAAYALHARRRARPGRSQLGWTFQAASCVAWAVTPVAWLAGLDGLAAAGRMLLVLLSATAWWLTSKGADTWSRVRLVVDSGLAAATALVVGWALVLEPIHERAGGGAAGALAVGAPLAAVGVATLCAGVALTEMHGTRRFMPGWWVVGLVLVAVSDVLHGLGATPFWGVGFACFAIATCTYTGTSERREVISTRRSLVHAPYVMLAPAAGTLAVHHAHGGVPAVEATTAVVMAALLLVRQHVTLSENRNLVQRLAASEALLRHQATHDALTGLAGRVLLHETLDDAAARRRRGEHLPVAVVFVDLDHFKVVNDTLGHAAGDDVLVQVARRIEAVLTPLDGATAVRMSGDEFAALLVGPAARDAAATAEAVLAAVERPMAVNGTEVAVGGSVGVAMADDDGDLDPSALLRASDVAMYEVKRCGKSGIAVAPASPP